MFFLFFYHDFDFSRDLGPLKVSWFDYKKSLESTTVSIIVMKSYKEMCQTVPCYYCHWNMVLLQSCC